MRFELGAMCRAPRVFLWGVTGIGDRAEAGLSALLERHRPSAVLGVGFCGGLRDSAGCGHVAVPAEVVSDRGGDPVALRVGPRARGRMVSVARVAADPEEKARLARRFGADYVDQESYGWALAAARFGLPLTVVRVVLDGPGDVLPTWHRPASWPSAALLPVRAFAVRRILGEAGTQVLCGRW